MAAARSVSRALPEETRPLLRPDGTAAGVLMGSYLLDDRDLDGILRDTGFDAAYIFEAEVMFSTLSAFDRVPSAAVFEVKRHLSGTPPAEARRTPVSHSQSLERGGPPPHPAKRRWTR